MTRSWQELAEISLSVAREAAELVGDGWRSKPDAAEKTRANLVTEYDLASERLIRERLAPGAGHRDRGRRDRRRIERRADVLL